MIDYGVRFLNDIYSRTQAGRSNHCVLFQFSLNAKFCTCALHLQGLLLFPIYNGSL